MHVFAFYPYAKQDEFLGPSPRPCRWDSVQICSSACCWSVFRQSGSTAGGGEERSGTLQIWVPDGLSLSSLLALSKSVQCAVDVSTTHKPPQT